jgi:hypothetical protein
MYIYLFIYIINMIIYFSFLRLLNIFLKNNFYYPFRILDIINFIINILIFCPITFFYFGFDILFITIIVNLNFFYILFHTQNMVNTSPRTKILINIFENIKIKKYTEKTIVENRIKRLLSSQQIIIDKKIIKLNNNKKSLYFINLIFQLIKKL